MAKKIIQAQMQQRRDTMANWAAQNPVLLSGELGIVSDDPNLYKVGDGTTAWNNLPLRGFDGTLVHTTGDSETAAMSQKGVTEELAKLSAEIDQYSPLQLALKNKSYSYVFKGNENSIAILRNPITLSKNGDSFEIEVDTEAMDALGAYPLSYCSPSGYAIGIAVDYISIRDVDGNWLLLTYIAPANNNHIVKVQYADNKIYVYIDGEIVRTFDSQSAIKIESFGNGGNGSYGYWKGTILSIKVNGEQYELYENAILGDVEIVDSETNSFLTEKEKEALESVAVLEPLAEKIAKWSYNYEFEGNSDSIATLNKPIILSKDGDSLEVEVFTEMKGADNSYTFAAKSESPSIALGIAADYVALRDVNNKWLYLNNTALSNTQKVKIEYIGGKVLLYINDVLTSTTDTQSDIRIDSFGDGSHGTYGYWKGTILSIKVNGEQYDLQENAILGDVVKSDSPSNSLLTDAEKKTLDSFQPTMLVRKTSETLQVGLNIPSSPYYVVYNLVKRYKAYQEGAYPSFMDNWGLKKPFVGKVANGMFVQVDRIFSDGEAEIAVGVTDPNQPQYSAIVGGAAHGFDNIINTDGNRGFLLLVDSKKIDEDSELDMRPCQEVTLLQHSELCQAYTNSNPWANAIKLWILTPTSAKLKCSISILRDIKIFNGYMGMFCVERHFNGDASAPYMTSKIIKNNHPFKVFVCEDGWSDNSLQIADSECTEVTLYGDTDYGYAVRVLQSSKTKGHGMFVHYNSPSNTYNKVYPQVAANYDAKTGDVISNEVEFVIRKSSSL